MSDRLFFHFCFPRLERSRIMSESASHMKTFLSSRPLGVVFNIRWVRLVLLVVAATYLGAALWAAHAISRMYLPHSLYYRFSALERRGGGPALSPGIQSFGLLIQEKGGHTVTCRAILANASYTVEGSSMMLSLRDGSLEAMPDAQFTGWYFVTMDKPGREADDPVCFCDLLLMILCFCGSILQPRGLLKWAQDAVCVEEWYAMHVVYDVANRA
jgi:hypothetical protein